MYVEGLREHLKGSIQRVQKKLSGVHSNGHGISSRVIIRNFVAIDSIHCLEVTQYKSLPLKEGPMPKLSPDFGRYHQGGTLERLKYPPSRAGQLVEDRISILFLEHS